MRRFLLIILFILSVQLIFAQVTDTIVDPRDGQVYNIVRIGDQWWMAENLKSTHYSDGTMIPLVEDVTNWQYLDAEDRAFCYFNNDSTNSDIYGALYTWAAAMNGEPSSDGNPSSVQGICPNGWHLPSDSEWKELELFLGMSQNETDTIYWRGTDEGGKLKESGTVHWENPNLGATNSSGFTALPGSGRSTNGLFDFLYSKAYFWSSAEANDFDAWFRHLLSINSSVYRHSETKNHGFSVRCIMNPCLVDEIILNKTDISCSGYADGLIELSGIGFGNYSYHWSNEDTLQNITDLSPGWYTITINDIYIPGCSRIDSIEILEPNPLIAQMSDSSNISCFGYSDGNATCTPTGGTEPYLYNWDNDLSSKDSIVTGLYANRYYHVSVTDANSCSVQDSIILSEPELLTATITDTAHISGQGLSDGAAKVTVSGGTPEYSYLWDDNLATKADSVSGLSADTWYHVTVTDANLCLVTDSVILPVTGLFSVFITEITEISCFGFSNGTATVSAFGGKEPYAYLWDNDAGTTTAQITDLEPDRWYHITVTDADMNTISDSLLLSEPDPIIIDFGEDIDLCRGETTTLHAGPGFQSYSWSVPDSALEHLTVNTSGTYYVAVTDNNGCQASDTVSVSVHPVPDAAVTSDQTICEGDSINIGSGDTGNIYEWKSQPPGFSSAVANPKVAPANTTTYILQETIQSTGCYKSDTVVITVNPLPDINVLDDQILCETTIIPLQLGSGEVTGNTYSWKSDPVGYVSFSSNPEVTPTQSIIYILTQTISETGCKAVDSVIVIINPIPVAQVAEDQAFCESEIVEIDLGADSVPGNIYNWTSIPPGFSSTDANPRVIPTEASSYILTETVAGTICKQSDTVQITINEDPEINIMDDLVTCPNELTSYQIGSDAVDGHSYSWSSDPGDFTSQDADPAVSPVETTKYYLTQSIDATGCTSTDSLQITVLPSPKISVINDTSFCESKVTSIILGLDSVPGNSYSWTSNPVGYESYIAKPEIVPSVTTKYFLMVSDGSNGCSDEDSVLVTIHPDPAVLFTMDENPIHREESTVLTASGAKTYKWLPSEELSDSTGSSVTAFPLITTPFTIIGTDSNGCVGNFTDNLIVNCQECDYLILYERTGHFNHGCSMNDYNNNADCSWIIYPGGIIYGIYLYFQPTSFDIKPGDSLKVYDGVNNLGTLIDVYDNNNPPSGCITLGDAVYIELITDDTITGRGFQATYSTEECDTLTHISPIDITDLKIYPNPTNNSFIVECSGLTGSNARINLYNSTGTLILNIEPYIVSGRVKTEIDISNYSQGIYYLQLFNKRNIVTRKIIKE